MANKGFPLILKWIFVGEDKLYEAEGSGDEKCFQKSTIRPTTVIQFMMKKIYFLYVVRITLYAPTRRPISNLLQ